MHFCLKHVLHTFSWPGEKWLRPQSWSELHPCPHRGDLQVPTWLFGPSATHSEQSPLHVRRFPGMLNSHGVPHVALLGWHVPTMEASFVTHSGQSTFPLYQPPQLVALGAASTHRTPHLGGAQVPL